VKRPDFRSPRLFVEEKLSADAAITLDKKPAHYLRNVLRLKADDTILVFNGKHGEWRAAISLSGKSTKLMVQEQVREQTPPSDIHYLFAPLKHERLDYMVQKAVEMGVSRLQPVLTRHTQVARVNAERMQANVIEAAEQCGILTIPEVGAPTTLGRMLAARKPDRLLVFCDEHADVKNPIAALEAARISPSAMLPLLGGAALPEVEPLAILIGPEGGFAEEEREALLKQSNIVRLSLGPRILRADTAGVAALALVQAVLGDARGS
jgi:16S rRNA (uracil1498-N3)-methyltransferase